VSTGSSLTTKDNSDKSQGPLNSKIVLLTTVNARFFLLSTELHKLFMPAMTCIRSPPSFNCFSEICHNESETVFSSYMSYNA
jgi:hypothetical protein